MRTDVSEPLFYAPGAGLTELALAWLVERRLASTLSSSGIEGSEHEGIANPLPQPDEIGFNFSIDPDATQVIFNESDIEIWQVPRDAYRQMLFSNTELEELAASPDEAPRGASGIGSGVTRPQSDGSPDR
ncbi:hypothetical protein [Sphingobium sp. EP60837]|nr:hypothetical protein [Sphingobium sp. EP60837]ANI77922.1 hypothetical protein EP837_01501 [Sphingobium sp. EP60837]